MNTSKSGFTIVELIIVIVVIGILASVAIVSYSGASNRALEVALSSDLENTAPLMENVKLVTPGNYPAQLPSDVRASKNVVLQLATVTDDSKEFCINAYHLSKPGLFKSWDSATNTTRPYLCSGIPKGTAVGGTVPTAPRNVNIVADFSGWTLTGGVSYSQTTGELTFSSAGNATSPLIRVDSPTSAKITIESYATTSSPTFTPLSGVHMGSLYFAADGVTAAYSSANYTGNGNAQSIPLSAWTSRSWTTTAGPNVIYVKFIVYSSPTNYTSNNRVQNVSVVGI